jgi:hypothetical protein
MMTMMMIIIIGQKHWYEHVPKSVETSQAGKVTILWNQQYKPTELSATANRTL